MLIKKLTNCEDDVSKLEINMTDIEEQKENDMMIIDMKNNDEDKIKDDFKPDNYFWINIVKDAKDSEIRFSPTQFVTNYIDKYLKHETYDVGIQKLDYLTCLSLSMIRRLRELHYYNEKLFEFSSISSYGIWRNSDVGYFQMNLGEEQKLTYIDDFDVTKVKKCFFNHEPNFLSSIEVYNIDDIILSDGKY